MRGVSNAVSADNFLTVRVTIGQHRYLFVRFLWSRKEECRMWRPCLFGWPPVASWRNTCAWRVCHIFMKFSVAIEQALVWWKLAQSQPYFTEGLKLISIRILRICWPIRMKFLVEYPHVIPFGNCEFCKYRYSESILKSQSERIFVFCTFSSSVHKIRYSRCPEKVTERRRTSWKAT
jgi:hypothetical protein